MRRFSKGTILFLVLLFLVGGGYMVSRLRSFSGGISPEFKEARLQGALIAQNIVDLSNHSASDLEKINELDSAHKFSEALALTTDAVKRSQEIRSQAVELSNQLEKMTRALSDIGSFEARQVALEAIASRLALINRLINYSNGLSQLLEVLRDRFHGVPTSSHEVTALVEQVNAEVRAINNFNSQASRAMDRFDELAK